MGPRFRLLICEWKTACLDPEWRLSLGPSLHLWFCAFKTATLASELLVPMGPSPHLCLLCAKQRLKIRKYKSLRVPDLDCWFVNEKSVLRSRMTLVYWSQPSSAVLCLQNSDFSIRITRLYRPQPSFVPFTCKTAHLGSELQVSMGPRLRLLICEWKKRVLRSRMTLVYWSQPSSVVLYIQNRDFSIRITSL